MPSVCESVLNAITLYSVLKMGTISERTLGRRTVFFMKNEALVGRIPKGRIRVLASVLGVASAGQMTTGARTKDEGNERYRYSPDKKTSSTYKVRVSTVASLRQVHAYVRPDEDKSLLTY